MGEDKPGVLFQAFLFQINRSRVPVLPKSETPQGRFSELFPQRSRGVDTVPIKLRRTVAFHFLQLSGAILLEHGFPITTKPVIHPHPPKAHQKALEIPKNLSQKVLRPSKTPSRRGTAGGIFISLH
ncbi:hypothetical protein [uncultured Pseudodesulfovibrio sp.]|uniref:hypothetical protein n=1 Tax=uncultured Pseudodesulfovibrio sp. TaxID=2035858 RepID=UPI0029C85495|nr:hypothetical protein [uncultured Pseudodesulfovibrio sp.]